MALPTFTSNRRHPRTSPSESSQENAPSPYDLTPTTSFIKRATRTRYRWSLVTSFLFLVSLVFLILVEVGNISPTLPVVGTIYFLKLDLSHIVASSVPNAFLINSIARTLGLHDFYQVGLWNFCEGYSSSPDAITGCSTPRTLYWFNPVEILLNELLAGASSTSPPFSSLPPVSANRFHKSPFLPTSSKPSLLSAWPPTGCSLSSSPPHAHLSSRSSSPRSQSSPAGSPSPSPSLPSYPHSSPPLPLLSPQSCLSFSGTW